MSCKNNKRKIRTIVLDNWVWRMRSFPSIIHYNVRSSQILLFANERKNVIIIIIDCKYYKLPMITNYMDTCIYHWLVARVLIFQQNLLFSLLFNLLFSLRYYGLHSIKDSMHMPSVLARLSTAIIEFLFGIIMDGTK